MWADRVRKAARIGADGGRFMWRQRLLLVCLGAFALMLDMLADLAMEGGVSIRSDQGERLSDPSWRAARESEALAFWAERSSGAA